MPTWADVIQAIAGVASVIATLVGFYWVRRQIKQFDLSARGETYGELYGQQHSITQFFIEKPHLRPFFYDGAEISSTDPEFRNVMAVAEMITDFLEHVYLQLPSLPDDIRQGWESYIKRIYTGSPAIQFHLRENGAWYGEEFINKLSETDNRLANAEERKGISN